MALRTKLRIFCCLGVSSSVMGPPYLYLYTVFARLARGPCKEAVGSPTGRIIRAGNPVPFGHGAALRIRSHPNDPRAAPGEAAHRPGAKKRTSSVVGQKARPRGPEAHPGIERQAAGLRLSKQGLIPTSRRSLRLSRPVLRFAAALRPPVPLSAWNLCR